MSEEETNWDDYETGPFCRHWGDPSDCEDLCMCGHQCSEHPWDDEGSLCACEEWREPPTTEPQP